MRWCFHLYGNEGDGLLMRRTAFNSSQMQTGARSKTWVWSAEDDSANPMWQGSLFSAPLLVRFRKKGGEARQEQFEKYVYAVLTDDFWKDCDSLFLLRALRLALPQLNELRWEARIQIAQGVLG
jgi:hypothetical protein